MEKMHHHKNVMFVCLMLKLRFNIGDPMVNDRQTSEHI